jgi:hypothetical protein
MRDTVGKYVRKRPTSRVRIGLSVEIDRLRQELKAARGR